MKKIKVRRSIEKNIYVHNELWNAASHFKNQIKHKIDVGDRKGITFEYMACLVMLAFTFEANINFLGKKLIHNWNEREKFDQKMRKIFQHLKITPSWNEHPYSSISALKRFRDLIAHGKPVEEEFNEEVEIPAEEVDRDIDLDSEWKRYCSPENVFETYAAVESLWANLLSAAGLTIHDTITHGSRSTTYVGENQV